MNREFISVYLVRTRLPKTIELHDYQDLGQPDEEETKSTIKKYKEKYPETKDYEVEFIEF